MAHLDEITVGCQLNGIAARETVTVIAVQWYGNAALEVTFKNSEGSLAVRFSIVETRQLWMC